MWSYSMFQILSKNKKVYTSLVFIAIIFVYIVDVQLYFNSDNRLEKKVLYFPPATVDSGFSPELHRIPLVSPLNAKKSVNNSSLEVFIKELFLGPQSIYNDSLVHNYVRLQRVIYSSHDTRNLAFIFLAFEDTVAQESKNIANNERINMIKEWLLFNINNYYDIDTITIFVDTIAI